MELELGSYDGGREGTQQQHRHAEDVGRLKNGAEKKWAERPAGAPFCQVSQQPVPSSLARSRGLIGSKEGENARGEKGEGKLTWPCWQRKWSAVRSSRYTRAAAARSSRLICEEQPGHVKIPRQTVPGEAVAG